MTASGNPGKKLSSPQAFLIKRFIYILVLVTVAQSLISFLISQAVMPVVMKVFFPDYRSV
jgi:hypothetical protein